MSRVGHLPIEIPDKVDVTIEDNLIITKGPKGELQENINDRLEVKVEDNSIVINRSTNSKDDKCVHGLSRSLVVNMIEGVTEGFKKELELSGVGYRAQKKGNKLELQVGYSHPVEIDPVEGIEFDIENDDKIIVSGVDKQKVGEVAANIRAVREPEPYNAKGIKYAGERIRTKEGKTG